ncbi:hypothetical protein UAJ10_07195 [Nitrospirillum sp. BR 11164]|uniref:hypothetical protein n=1 Tax=Nitrospirillum sp. BR 11164 TaxID=3104324 RepID=UPI002AFF6925|nr:hypothetical protein [Nitrospirillum sp. BR 11164]MEA1648800.1 hypothetical protein [Nitrospirillum sp. BR 11164]
MHQYTYRLLTDSAAKKKAKKLVEIVELMGFDLKLSRAQELVAGLMGYDNWAELVQVTRKTPEQGVPDQMLTPEDATARQKHQIALLVAGFSIDESNAIGILEALAPTGNVMSLHWPSVDKLDLRLTDEDAAWLDASMELVQKFDAAVRPLYKMPPAPIYNDDTKRLTRIGVEITVPGKRKLVVRNTRPDDIIDWVAACFPPEFPLNGEMRAEVAARAEEACQIFLELDGRIRALGAAPMLASIDRTFLMLHRARVSEDTPHFTALCPEPRLNIGFDLPYFSFAPENKWNASRALSLQLALRREFLDAGWTGEGQEWRVTFREGNYSKEELVVRADSSGAAWAWVAAARAALRLTKHQTIRVISLLSIVGPDGAVDPHQALRSASEEAIIRRGKLLKADSLRVRGPWKTIATNSIQ